jgi:hypothetical protein
MHAPGDDEDTIRDRAPWIWSALRGAVEQLTLDGVEQIKDPNVDECFLWDVGYPPSWTCEALGWISPELRSRLDEITNCWTG